MSGTSITLSEASSLLITAVQASTDQTAASRELSDEVSSKIADIQVAKNQLDEHILSEKGAATAAINNLVESANNDVSEAIGTIDAKTTVSISQVEAAKQAAIEELTNGSGPAFYSFGGRKK